MMEELMPKVNNLFDFLSVHKELLEDDGRVKGYARAIAGTVKPGDVVLDLGTGTGLLALMAAAAGAAKVYALESGSIIRLAQQIAEKNDLADSITFLHSNSLDASLPERVDVIVSEIIGHCILDENMLDSLIDARHRFMKPKTGRMIPESVEMRFVPISDNRVYDKMRFWKKKINGFDFSPAWKKLTNTLYVEDFEESCFLSNPKSAAIINLYSVQEVDLSGNAAFQVRRDDTLHGFAAWFKVRLCTNPKVALTSGPTGNTTSWKSTYFPLEEPIEVRIGDKLTFDFSCFSLSNDTTWEWGVSCQRGRRIVAEVSQSTAAY